MPELLQLAADGEEHSRQQLVELVCRGHRVASLANEFRLSPQTIRNWVKQADRNEREHRDD